MKILNTKLNIDYKRKTETNVINSNIVVLTYYMNIQQSINQHNLGHSTLIYLPLINVACKFSWR